MAERKRRLPNPDRRFPRFMDRVLAPGVLAPWCPHPVDVRDMGWMPRTHIEAVDEYENLGLSYLEAAPRTAEKHPPRDGHVS